MWKRVHFVHFSSRPGGIEVKRPILIQNLKNYFFSVFVIRRPAQNEKNVYDKITVPVTYGAKGAFAYLYLFRYGFNNRKDLFHVFNIGPFALLALRMAGVKKLIYGIHGTIYWKTTSQYLLRKLIWKMALSRHYKITSNSVFSGNVFNNEISRKAKIIVLYNPIDNKKFKKIIDSNSIEKVLRIVYVGRLCNGKNLFTWLEVARSIHAKYTNAIFEIYGDGPLKGQLNDFVSDNSLNEYVYIKGFCESPEEIYQNSDLLLFLSEYESFGNVVIESILSETPVIVSAIPSMREIFINFPEFLVNLDNNLEENILTKIGNLDLLNNSAKNAAIEFRTRFSLDQHLEKVEELYESFNP